MTLVLLTAPRYVAACVVGALGRSAVFPCCAVLLLVLLWKMVLLLVVVVLLELLRNLRLFPLSLSPLHVFSSRGNAGGMLLLCICS